MGLAQREEVFGRQRLQLGAGRTAGHGLMHRLQRARLLRLGQVTPVSKGSAANAAVYARTLHSAVSRRYTVYALRLSHELILRVSESTADLCTLHVLLESSWPKTENGVLDEFLTLGGMLSVAILVYRPGRNSEQGRRPGRVYRACWWLLFCRCHGCCYGS